MTGRVLDARDACVFSAAGLVASLAASPTHGQCPFEWSGGLPQLNSNVNALTVYNGELVAGGEFSTVDGQSVSRIVKWNGASWFPLGTGIAGTVYALTIYDGRLIAGGDFISAGGVSAKYIAQWDGNSWSPLGSGMGATGIVPFVKALAVYNNELIAGGQFTTAGGAAASRIAKWDGTSWSPLGAGVTGAVYALIVHEGELVVGGIFNSAGGISTAKYAAKWNGTSWSALPGMTGYVNALAIYNGELIAGGDFAISFNRIAKWNGSSWSGLGSGIYHTGSPYARVLTVGVYQGDLYAGGYFDRAGGVTARGTAKWNGAAWSALDATVGGEARATTIYDGDLTFGGPIGLPSGLNYWARWGSPCPPGDFDADRDVDADDFALFQECLDSPGEPVPPPECSVDADLDDDTDVDLQDFAVFQDTFSGPA